MKNIRQVAIGMLLVLLLTAVIPISAYAEEMDAPAAVSETSGGESAPEPVSETSGGESAPESEGNGSETPDAATETTEEEVKTMPEGSVTIESHVVTTGTAAENPDTPAEELEGLINPVPDSDGVLISDSDKTVTEKVLFPEDVQASAVTGESKLQTAIDKALEQAKATGADSNVTSQTVTIKLTDGTYTGDLDISGGLDMDDAVKENLTLVLAAADTVQTDDNGNLLRDAQTGELDHDASAAKGNVVIDGNIDIDGINVILYGIYLATNKIVEAKNSTLEINGTQKDDAYTVTMESNLGKTGSLAVNAQGGSDTVNVTLDAHDGTTASAAIQADDDSVTVTGTGKGTVNVAVTGGDGNENITVTQKSNAMAAKVETGAGDDTISLSAGGAEGSYTIAGGAGDDTINLTATSDAAATNHSFAIDPGAGDDTVSVNADLSYAAESLQLTENAEERNTLNLCGELEEEDDRISGNKSALTLKGRGGTLMLNLTGFTVFTDSLSNKEVVKVTLEKLAQGITLNSFTDYQINAGDTAAIGSFSKAAGQELLLTNIFITAQKELNFIGTIDVDGANLYAYAPDIHVADGALIQASSVNLYASDHDSNILGSSQPTGKELDTPSGKGSLHDIVTTAKVVMAEGAKIVSTAGSVALSAIIQQTKTLAAFMSFANNYNPIGVKIGTALVEICGTIVSALDVLLNSRSTVEVKATNKGLASAYVPLAVGIAVTETDVKVLGNAAINAQGDVSASANSKVTVKAEANTGKLPLAIATAVAVNDTHAVIGENSTITAGGDVNVEATAESEVVAGASNGGLKGNSGAFVAVQVTEQSTSAAITGSANVTAGGEVKVSSQSKETASASATAASPEQSDEPNAMKDLLKEVKTLLFAVGKQGVGKAWEKIGPAADKVCGENYKINQTPTQHGTISAPASFNPFKEVKVEDIQEGEAVFTRKGNGTYVPAKEIKNDGTKYYRLSEVLTIKVIPNAGYKLDKLEIKYLIPGASEYTTATLTDEDGDGIFKVDAPPADVTITASFVEGTAGSVGKAEDDDAALSDLFDQAAEGAKDENENLATEDAKEGEAYLKLETAGSENGALVLSAKKIALGKDVLVMPNPKEGYSLKAGSLKLTYTGVDGSSKEVQLQKNEQGKFVWSVPTDAMSGGTVKVSAEFVEDTSKEADQNSGTEKSASTLQLSAALAAGVALNTNKAYIDTTGIINAGGNVNVNAVGSLAHEVKADGSAIVPAEEEKEEPETPDTSETTAEQWLVPRPIKIGATKNGQFTLDTDASDFAAGKLVFKALPNSNYRTGNVVVNFTDTNGKPGTFTLKPQQDGSYVIGAEEMKQMAEDSLITIATEFWLKLGIDYNKKYEETYANAAKIAETKNGSIQSISADPVNGIYAFAVKPNTGYKLDSFTVTLKVKNDNGSIEDKTVDVSADQKGNYFFKLSSLFGKEAEISPIAGTLMTFDASFAADTHSLTKKDDTITLASGITSTPCSGDTISFEIKKPENATDLGEVYYTYKESADAQETKVEVEVDKTGKYSFVMPAFDVTICVDWLKKDNAITVSNNGSGYVKLSQDAAAEGEEVEIFLTDNAIQAGKKITGITYTVNGKVTELKPTEAGAYVLSGFTAGEKNYVLDVTIADKLLKVSGESYAEGHVFELDHSFTDTDGVVKRRVDANEKLIFTIKPGSGFKVKTGTVYLTVMEEAGGKWITKEIAATALGGGKYSVVIPEVKDGTKLTLKAGFSTGIQGGDKNPEDPGASVGAAVSVGVTKLSNTAYVENVAIKAKGLAITADSEGAGTVTAKAGYSNANVGIGGAVAVNVMSQKTRAALEDIEKVTLTGGELTVAATSTDTITTEADASGSEDAKGSSLGVGAGIAVAVTGVDTLAEVKGKNENPDAALRDFGTGITISAASTEQQSVNAKAGAAGGIAVTPVLSLLVAGADTRATLHSGNPLKVGGDIKINAASDLQRTLAADASAAGNGCGVGASFTISVLNDTTHAKLSRGVNANNVAVTTSARNRATSTSKASASGAASSGDSSSDSSGDGESDRQAASALNAAARLSSSVGTNNTSAASVSKSASKRQSSSTTEGSIQVAAAMALNIQDIAASAIIDGNAAIEASEDVLVQTLTRNENKVVANGSAANGKTGVGVAVSINIVSYDTQASIGDASVTAQNLTVHAGLLEDEEEEAEEDEESPDSSERGWLEKLITDAVNSLVDELLDAMGLNSMKEGLNDVVQELVTNVLAALTEDTGLDALIQNNPVDTIKKNLSNLQAYVLNFPNKLLKPIEKIIAYVYGTDTEDVINASQSIVNAFATHMEEETWPKIQENLIKNTAGGIVSAMTDTVKKGDIQKLSATISEKLKEAMKDTLEQATDGAKAFLLNKINEVLNDKGAELDDLTKESLNKVIHDWLEKGLINEVTSLATDGLCDSEKLMSFVKDNFKDTIVTNLKAAVVAAGTTLTNAALDGLSNWMDLKVEVEDQVNAHSFDTQAIAGVSSKGVGVAGSVALAIINGTTNASIKALDAGNTKDIDVGGTVEVVALGNHNENTVASAAENNKGEADANLAAGANDKTTTSSTGNKEGNEFVEFTAGAGGTISIKAEEPGKYIKKDEGYTRTFDYKLNVVLDEGMKTKKITLAFVDAKGNPIKGSDEKAIEFTFDDAAKVRDFRVVEYSDSEKKVQMYRIYYQGEQSIDVEAGQKAIYNATFISEKSVSRDVVDVIWTGEGSASIADDFKVTAKASDGYQALNNSAVARFEDTNGKQQEIVVKLSELTINRITSGSGETQKVSYALQSKYNVKPGTTISIYVDFIGAHKVSADGKREFVSNQDDTANHVYTYDNGTLTVLRLAYDSTNSLYAAPSDRIAVIVKPRNGYKLSSLTLKGNTGVKFVADPAIVDPNGGVAYLFTMPNAAAHLVPVFEVGEVEQTKPTNTAGKTVGAGAGFAMTISNVTASAEIGNNRKVTAGALDIRADADHKVVTAGAAGTDPLSGEAASAKDIGLDAAVAVTLTDNKVYAIIGNGCVIVTTGGDDVQYGEDADEKVNVNIAATQTGETLTKASAFAAGGKTAVGASVTINIADSDVKVTVNSGITANGAARIVGSSSDQDRSKAVATAMGADMQRYFDKFGVAVGSAANKANDITSGKVFEESLKKPEKPNQTAASVNNKLTANQSDPSDTGRKQISGNLPASTNALRSQNVTGESSKKAADAANTGISQANSNSGTTQVTGATATESQTFQVAAAVGLNITNHKVNVIIAAPVEAASVEILANNHGNFETLGTGIAMSMGKGSNSIAAGVAVAVGNNEANIRIKKDIKATGDVTVEASTTQNMDDDFRGLLGAQALAGAVSGNGGKTSFAGSVAIIVDKAKTTVMIADGTAANHVTINGDNVRIAAIDKSKLALRAGGVSLSRGSAVGVGAAFALIYGKNNVTAEIGRYTNVNASSLTILADKQKVDYGDYKSAVNTHTFITDTSSLTQEQKKNAEKGFINLDKDEPDDENYKVEINVSGEDALHMVNALNALSSTNYYAEAVAGSIITGGNTTANVAGSVAMVFTSNTISAYVDSNAVLNITGDEGMTLEASNESKIRILAGSVSAAPSKVGAGVTVSFLDNHDTVAAQMGNDGKITADQGGYTQNVTNKADVLGVNVAASVSTKANSTASAGGALNVILMNSKAHSTLGRGVIIVTKGDVTMGNDVVLDMILADLSVAGGNSTVAAGGTISVIINNSEALTKLNNAVITSSNGDVVITVLSSEKLINVLASASASPTGTAAVAGSIGVLVSGSKANITGNGGSITGRDILIRAETVAELVDVAVAGALTTGTVGVGATVLVNVLNRESLVDLGTTTLKATQGNILLEAVGTDFSVIVGVGASSGGNSFAGAIPVFVSNTKVEAKVGTGSNLTAYGSVGVIADLNSRSYLAGGELTLAGGIAVGATVATQVLNNTVNAYVGNHSILSGSGKGNILNTRRYRRDNGGIKGIAVSAVANDTVLTAAVAGGLSSGTAVNGTVVTLVVKNTVTAQVGENVTVAVTDTDNDGDTSDEEPPAFTVEAIDDSDLKIFAGGLSVGFTSGIGATVLVMPFNKTVIAKADKLAALCAGDVTVNAQSSDNVWLLALAFGAGATTGVAGDVNVLVFNNKTHAILGMLDNSAKQSAKSISITATSSSDLDNIGLGVALGANVGAVAVAVITYFYNDTLAEITAGHFCITGGGNVNVLATSTENVNADAAGAGASVNAGVGGTLDLIITKVVTIARIGDGVVIEGTESSTRPDCINVKATDNYTLLAVVATAALGAAAGVSVTALVGLSYNTVKAIIGNGVKLTSDNCICVEASSNREIKDYVANAAAGGGAGVAVIVSVVVAGASLNQDAHDALYNTTDKKGNKPMDPQNQVDGAFKLGNQSALAGAKPKDSLTDLLQGDGNTASDRAEGYDDFGQTSTGGKQYETNGTANGDGTGTGTVNPDYLDNQSDKIGSFNTPTPSKGLADTVVASVGEGSVLVAVESIDISAIDTLTLTSVAGGIAIGGSAGVGVGISVATLSSKVTAEVNDATLEAHKITVYACSGTGTPSENGPDTSKMSDGLDAVNASINESLGNNTPGAIQLIGVTGAVGGAAGVGVTLGFLMVCSEVKAAITGGSTILRYDEDSKTRGSLDVHGKMDFQQILTCTVAVAVGGTAGVGVSLGGAIFSGKVNSTISGSHSIRCSEKWSWLYPNVSVRTTGGANAIAFAAGVAAGAAAVTVNLATVVNQTDIETGIRISGNINSTYVNVTTDFNTDSRGYLVAVSGGLTGVGVGVVVVLNRVNSQTYLDLTGSSLYAYDSVTVSSNLSGNIDAIGLGLSAGALAVNGTVVLGISKMNGTASVNLNNTQFIVRKDVTVQADMRNNVMVTTTSISAGVVAAGATVAVAYVDSCNEANVTLTETSTLEAENFRVGAGQESEENGVVNTSKYYQSTAQVVGINGQAGAAAFGVNVGVATNTSQNRSSIFSDATSAINVRVYLDSKAYGTTRAYAVLADVGIGAVRAMASVAVANLSSVQEALLTSNGFFRAGYIHVVSKQNYNDGSYGSIAVEQNLDGSSLRRNLELNAMAEAFVISGGIALGSLTLSTARATADASSIARAIIVSNDTDTGNQNVFGYGDSKAIATVFSWGVSGIKFSELSAYAEAKGTVKANLQILGDPAGAPVKVTGNVYVETKGTAESRAQVKNGTMDVTLVGAGGGFMYAATTATYIAGIDLAGHLRVDGVIGQGAVKVYNGYTANAYAETTDGDLSLGLLNANTNEAKAETKPYARAYIQGDGVINSSSATVEANGTATAQVRYVSPKVGINGISIRANTLTATVGPQNEDEPNQDVYIDIGKLDVYHVKIYSYYNRNADASNPAAKVFFESELAKASLASAVSHELTASDDSWVRGRFNLRSDDIEGKPRVLISTIGRSYARADVTGGALNASVFSAGIVKAEAFANGRFESIAGVSNDAQVTLASLEVICEYYLDAYAATAQPMFGVSGIGYGKNIAFAQAGKDGCVNGSALLKGPGKLLLGGDLEVRLVGHANADAQVGLGGSISAVTVALNIANAYVYAQNEVGANNVELETECGVSFESDLKKSCANAKTGSPNNVGWSMSLLTRDNNEAYAYNYARNYIRLNAAKIISDDGIDVDAISHTKANATTMGGANVSFLALGSLYTYAEIQGDTQVFIHDSELISKDGSVKINAINHTSCTSSASTQVSVALVGNHYGNAEVNLKSLNAKVNLTGKTWLEGKYAVDIEARNYEVFVQSYSLGGKGMAVVENRSDMAEATSAQCARVEIGKDVTLRAYSRPEEDYDSLDCGIFITVWGDVTSEEKLDSTSYTILCSSDYKYAWTKAHINLDVVIEGTLWSDSNINIETYSTANLTAITTASDNSFFVSSGTARAVVDLKRYVNVVLDGAKLYALGDIRIDAKSGSEDNIYAKMEVKASAGLTGTAQIKVDIWIINDNRIRILNGAQIISPFGNVEILAIGSAGNIKPEISLAASGILASSSAQTNVYYNSTFIGEQQVLDNEACGQNILIKGTQDNLVKILGRNTTINAYNDYCNVWNYTAIGANGFLTSSNAYSYIKLMVPCKVQVEAAQITGDESLLICASADFQRTGYNIPTHIRNDILVNSSGIKFLTFRAKITTNRDNTIELKGSQNIFTGSDIEFRTVRGDKYKASATIKKADGEDISENKISLDNSTDQFNIGLENARFYLGEGLGGFYVYHSESIFRYTGSVEPDVTVTSDGYYVKGINVKLGGKVRVKVNSNIISIRGTGWEDLKLNLYRPQDRIDVILASAQNCDTYFANADKMDGFAINFIDGAYSYCYPKQKKFFSISLLGYEDTEVTCSKEALKVDSSPVTYHVISYNRSDVHIEDSLNNAGGTITFEWRDPRTNSILTYQSGETAPSIWAGTHQIQVGDTILELPNLSATNLHIRGAGNIGTIPRGRSTAAEAPVFSAMLAVSGGHPQLTLDAGSIINANLILAELVDANDPLLGEFNSQWHVDFTEAPDAEEYISITFGAPVRIRYSADRSFLEIYSPTGVYFSGETKDIQKLESDRTYDLSELDRYETGTATTEAYTLADGTVVERIVSIGENGETVTTYYKPDGTVVRQEEAAGVVLRETTITTYALPDGSILETTTVTENGGTPVTTITGVEHANGVGFSLDDVKLVDNRYLIFQNGSLKLDLTTGVLTNISTTDQGVILGWDPNGGYLIDGETTYEEAYLYQANGDYMDYLSKGAYKEDTKNNLYYYYLGDYTPEQISDPTSILYAVVTKGPDILNAAFENVLRIQNGVESIVSSEKRNFLDEDGEVFLTLDSYNVNLDPTGKGEGGEYVLTYDMYAYIATDADGNEYMLVPQIEWLEDDVLGGSTNYLYLPAGYSITLLQYDGKYWFGDDTTVTPDGIYTNVVVQVESEEPITLEGLDLMRDTAQYTVTQNLKTGEFEIILNDLKLYYAEGFLMDEVLGVDTLLLTGNTLANTITFPEGTEMRYELLSEDIARVATADGYRYLYKVSGTWQEAALGSDGILTYNGQKLMGIHTENGIEYFSSLDEQGNVIHKQGSDGSLESFVDTLFVEFDPESHYVDGKSTIIHLRDGDFEVDKLGALFGSYLFIEVENGNVNIKEELFVGVANPFTEDIVEQKSQVIMNASGDINVHYLMVTSGSEVDLNAGKDLHIVNSMIVEHEDLGVGEAVVNLSAGRDIRTEFMIAAETDLNMTAGRDIIQSSHIIIGGSQSLAAGRDVHIDNLNASDAPVTIVANRGDITGTIWKLNGTTLDASMGGSFLVADLDEVDSEISITKLAYGGTDSDSSESEKPGKEEITIPVSGESGTIHVSAVIEGTNVTLGNIQEAIDSEMDSSDFSGTLKIDLSGVNAVIKSLEILADDLRHIVNKRGDVTLEVAFPHGSVTLDAKSMEAILAQHKGTRLRLILEETDELTMAQRSAIAGMGVYGTWRAYLYDAETNTRIYDLRGGRIILSILFEIPAGKQADGFVVYGINEKGEMAACETRYEDGRLIWVTGELMDFVIVYSPGTRT